MGYYISTYINKKVLFKLDCYLNFMSCVSFGAYAQRKWKNVCLAFIQEIEKLKMQKSGEGAEKWLKYPYYDMFVFPTASCVNQRKYLQAAYPFYNVVYRKLNQHLCMTYHYLLILP